MHSSDNPIVLIVGTRPEAIKMIPVYYALKDAGLAVRVCATLQHDQLLMELFDLFQIVPDYNLNIMRLGQDLFYLTQAILQKTKELFVRIQPSLVMVQGDTTSAMAASLAAFYLHIPVAHVEAGLRTESITSPFPEEMNRRFIGMLAQYHFAPTATAAAALRAEGVQRSAIFSVGNTVVDALRLAHDRFADGRFVARADLVERVKACNNAGMKIMILTVHRRESFDGGITRVLNTVAAFLREHSDVFCFYPFHPNPAVIAAVQETEFSLLRNSYVCEPVTYKDMVYLMQSCHWIVTDSGGIQEEAVSLCKPVLVVRENTERPEGVQAGIARLVGTDVQRIAAALQELVTSSYIFDNACASLYGDGYAAEKIARSITTCMQPANTIVHDQSSTHASSVVYNKELFARQTKDFHNTPAPFIPREKTMKKICMIGLGYIGLPTALVAAEHGFQVCGVDIDEQRVADIMQGNPVIDEPDLSEKLSLALQSGTFTAATKPCQADYYIIAVPTPIQDDTTADISSVFAAADALVSVLSVGATVILESTVPVGTTQQLAAYLSKKTGLVVGKELFVAHCPERVLPGNIVRELIDNARIIGGVDRASVDAAKQMYKAFVKGNLYLTDATTAEMVKLVENSSRDAQLAFAHQVASMAYAAGLNPYEVIELANKHPRVNILRPTCGVGGHCIAVDPWFLVHSFPEHSNFVRAARVTNDNKPYEVIARIEQEVAAWHAQQATSNTQEAAPEKPKVPTVLLLGLAYKPDVNDLRESPALMIAQKLIAQAACPAKLTEAEALPGSSLPSSLFELCRTGLRQANTDETKTSPGVIPAQAGTHATNVMGFGHRSSDATAPHPMRILVCEPHLNKTVLANYVGDAAIGATEGVAMADIIVYLVAHKRFAAFDATALQGKRVLDFCGILHKNRPSADGQEHLFWPASKGDDAVSAQVNNATTRAEQIQ